MQACARAIAVCVLCLVLAAPAEGSTQVVTFPLRAEARSAASTVATNAVLGVAVTATGQLLRGNFSYGELVRGAAGGVTLFAGKRLAVERFAGAGLLARQANAVGASLVQNAARGNGTISALALPVGPVRLYVSTSGGHRIHPRLDLATAVAAVYAGTRANMQWDAVSSLSAGAIVFRTEGAVGGSMTAAEHSAGVLWITADESAWNDERSHAQLLFGHERVHVLQYDFAQHALGHPLQSWIVAKLPAMAGVSRYLDLGMVMPLWGLANAVVPYVDRPWEREARVLERRPPIW